MVSWIALVFALLSGFIASIALGVALWVYFKGPKFKEFEIDDLYDALLEQNDANALFKEQPFDD
jgi:hypothetical protein